MAVPVVQVGALCFGPGCETIQGKEKFLEIHASSCAPNGRIEMAPLPLQADTVFEGMDGPDTLVKYNPLSNLTSKEVSKMGS